MASYVWSLTQSRSDLWVGGAAANLKEAHARIRRTRPDLVIADHDWNCPSFRSFLTRLRAFDTPIPVLLCTRRDEMLYATDALLAGADSYVTEGAPYAVLVDAVERAVRRDPFLSVELLDSLSTQVPPC